MSLPPDAFRWDLARLDEQLAAAWQDVRPFPHAIIDDLLPAASVEALCQGIAAEPHWPNRSELYDFMGSADEVTHPTLRAFHGALASDETRSFVGRLVRAPLATVELRSYVYLAGHYLLPHTDYRAQRTRRVAFAYYVSTVGCEGGELELFACTTEGERVIAAEPARTVAPLPNRLVLFDVSPASLHQVREVTAGARLSLSGWFCT